MTHSTALAPASRAAMQLGAPTLLQRKCACGNSASPLTGECTDCARGKSLGLQHTLPIGTTTHASKQRAGRETRKEARFAHDFAHLQSGGVPAWQPKLAIGAPGDRFEQEADATAERVMRETVAPVTSVSRLAVPGGFATLQRDTRSPYSIDEGVVQELVDAEAAASVQMKPAVGAAGAAAVSATLAGRIGGLRPGGAALPGPLRAFMEPRFGHDFSRVRIHTGGDATDMAARLDARAFTVGSDIVFGAGQFDATGAAGLRLLAHELTHVVQQGHASRVERGAGSATIAARRADFGSDMLRRVVWHPNKPTGKASAPWGTGGPTGKLLEGTTDAGTPIKIWRPEDGKTYWCHGYTFGGSTAKAGPYSIFGETVPAVLKDDGWKPTYSCMAQPSDILVFSDALGLVMHSGIVRSVVAPGGRVDDAKSTLESKWGSAPLNTSSWETNAKQYGKYRCYSKAPLTGVCSGNGAHEQ